MVSVAAGIRRRAEILRGVACAQTVTTVTSVTALGAFTMASTSDASTTTIPLYKGKFTNRSWHQLPPEIIRLIATHYLLDVSPSSYCPQTWEIPQFWPMRMMYTVLRDALQVEKLMQICPSWHTAIETHLFWQHACAVIDPHDLLLAHSIIQPNPNSAATATANARPVRLSPFQHFRNITSCSCYVCRINHPYQDHGLTSWKRNVHTYWLGTVPSCREHRKATFCGLCLREAPPMELEEQYNAVLALAQEKLWLRKHTKLPDMLQQAIAASRYASREEGYSSTDDLSEDEEEDPELLSITEEAGGVRDLAINDFARNRILDGYWFSPADQWYGHTNGDRSPIVRAIHPCPWSLDQEDGDENTLHPRPATVRAETPPSFQLCEAVYRAYQKQMRIVLLPAMNNIVRKIVIECAADRVDPALRASRMEMEDVAAALRDESMWYNGIDWLERRANKKREERDRLRREEEEDRESSTSSKSDDSHATSPVLSTSTLGTTPSPPPLVTKKDDEVEGLRQVPIPVSPVLETPRLLHPIPYIPVTTSHMPPFSQEAFKMVWREACQPLYQCRCKICERAMIKANIEAGNLIASELQAQQAAPESNVQADDQNPGEIRIEDAEEEVHFEEEEEEVEEEETSTTTTEDARVYTVTPRKRSRDLEEDAEGESDRSQSGEEDDTERSRTPPKRVRREGNYSALIATTRVRLSASKKRSSEELDDGPPRRSASRESGKRRRMSLEKDVDESEEDSGTSPPTSVLPSAEEEFDDDLEVTVTPSRGRRAASPSRVPRAGHKVPSIGDAPEAALNRTVPSVAGLTVGNAKAGHILK
ncbi:hypothetical protein GLOTRDRAFT_121520 [Gloeophyllum trabeum ATCC 11539]|uniref:Uncharacterized protein n=1 Tax=Gloeophyllum trabeum (strain ATCC 11539 / FP-39264 / Madison 617) TaxID=670483 RepID=S7Q5N3_GLOTA|nr:uncharacterized protein GLOTRDRAFT_121520 [Gloeophyllum trabeum ATCC 11539]EPQ55366.1 hypothetical protein GLOTRDRAFT_121520 [Gloeophyllum trabeum ATCC 11539]